MAGCLRGEGAVSLMGFIREQLVCSRLYRGEGLGWGVPEQLRQQLLRIGLGQDNCRLWSS